MPSRPAISSAAKPRYGRLIGDQTIDQGDRSKTDHRITAELAGVCRQNSLSGIGDNRLGNPNFLVVKVQQAAVGIDTANTDQCKVELELVDEIDTGLANDTAIAAYIVASDQDFNQPQSRLR